METYPDPEGRAGNVVRASVASVPVLVFGALTTDVMVWVRRLVIRTVLPSDGAGGVGKP